MKKDVKTTNTLVRTGCIGCEDCKGACQELFELAFVPDTVLRYAHANR